MSKMFGDEVTVSSQLDGSKVSAILMRCSKCRHTEFIALLIGKKQDLHLQCLKCNECHCAHDSECNLPLGDQDD